MISKIYNIQIITPIFGGGVKASENDPVTPIRPSSIRGHLRFWWRATRGARCKSVAELRQREGEIWGTTDNPSKVITEVSIISKGKSYACAELDTKGRYFRVKRELPQYAIFPFQGNTRKNEMPANCISGIIFNLKLIYSQADYQDVDAAVWAWVNFGGVGSRTRRGCGALYCEELAPRSGDSRGIKAWYSFHLNDFWVDNNNIIELPKIPQKILINPSNGKPMEIWENLIEIMKNFRQGAGFGRNPGNSQNQSVPGRSRWPEPETIRNVSELPRGKHKRMDHIPDDAFPRSELGLPIIFHFKDDQHGDPADSELTPMGKKRMSSPIILRPLAVGDGKKAVPMIVRLSVGPLMSVELKRDGALIASSGEEDIRNMRLAEYRNSPMSGLTNKGSALEAFISFAKSDSLAEKYSFKAFIEVGL
ncbi:MAG: type III-B CRISPR module RAMP protein Cmr1 [Methanothrix sp.]